MLLSFVCVRAHIHTSPHFYAYDIFVSQIEYVFISLNEEMKIQGDKSDFVQEFRDRNQNKTQVFYGCKSVPCTRAFGWGSRG